MKTRLAPLGFHRLLKEDHHMSVFPSQPRRLARLFRVLLGVTGLVWFTLASAQNTLPQEYSDLIRSQSVVGPLDSSLLGEVIDYDTGSTDFETTDVSLAGSSTIPVTVGRVYHVRNQQGGMEQGAFGDWDLDIPHIEGIVATSVGWTVPVNDANGRCTYFGAPPAASVMTGSVTTSINPSEYSAGYSLVIPGSGRREMLARATSNTQMPNNGGLYPVVTRDWWTAQCIGLIGTQNEPTPDEGFVFHSPTGVIYQFDTISTRPYRSLQRPADTATAGVTAVLSRQEVWLLPSKITDRFGNTVTYIYAKQDDGSNQPIHITASDGRSISLQYQSSMVTSISDGTRTWHYGYSSGALTSVTLPDGASWAISFGSLDAASWTYPTSTNCTTLGTPTLSGSVSGTIRHPTGAFGTFTFNVIRHGRSGGPSTCLTNSVGTAIGILQPNVYDVLSLTKKQITGPNISGTLNWTLAYSGCSSSSCGATTSTLVTDPLSISTNYSFGAVYNGNEGMLLELDKGGSGGGSYLRTETYTYYAATGQSYPSLMGTPTQSRGDTVRLTTLQPVQTRTVTQDGASYIHSLSNLDAFGYPQTITRSGSNTKTDSLVYSHNTLSWVLGTLQSRSSGGTTEFAQTLNSNSQPTQITMFGRVDRTLSYNNDGTVASIKDGDNQQTTYSNYYLGIPQTVQYANSDTETVSVSSIGGIASWTHGGYTTNYGHDAMGRVSLIQYPGGYSQTNISWSTSSGGWSSTESTGGYTKTTTYDAFLHPVSTNESNLRTVTQSWDADGNNTFTSYPGSSSGITTNFDRLGRPISSIDGGGYTASFAYNANAMTTTDRDGQSTSYRYLTYDEPTAAWPTSIATPIATTTISRDLWGKPLQITRGSVTRTRSYNGYQQLSSSVDPERNSVSYGYDSAGNVTSVSPNGGTSQTRGYDARNRLTSIAYANGDPGVTQTWTSDSKLLSSTRGVITHTFGYDGRRQLTGETLNDGCASYSLTYGYDSLGHLSSTTYPDNTTIQYAPNALGEPTQAGSYATGASYFANGAVASFQYGNNISHSLTLDNRQLPSQSYDAGVLNDVYAYDGNRNPVGISDNQFGLRTRTIAYDSGNRLKSVYAANLWGNAQFGYDANDNLTTDVTGQVTTNFNVDFSNRVASVTQGGSSASLTYDAQGNIIQLGSGFNITQLSYYGSNLPARVTRGDHTFAYAYDGPGLRAITTTSVNGAETQVTTSLYGGSGQLLYEYAKTQSTTTPTTSTKYIYLGGRLVAKDITAGSTEQVVYQHTDALGTPVYQTDASRTLLGSTATLPYGGPYSNSGVGAIPGPGYAGQYTDGSGLVYMRARFYSPDLHRFLSTDPEEVDVKGALNFNRYSYATNSPYRNFDPSGRCATSDVPDDNSDDGLPCPSGPQSSPFSDALESVNQFTMAMGPVGMEVVGVEKLAVTASEELAENAAPLLEESISLFARIRQLGSSGETAVRNAFDIGEKVAIDVNGRTRIPDGINDFLMTLSEVKNVGYQAFTAQLRDYSLIAQEYGYTFNLYLRPTSEVSQPLQAAFDCGLICRMHIPQ